jgi:transcriptional regulator with GAF, ATPase, and Fis domain
MLLPEDRAAFRRMITRLRTTTSGVPFAPPLEPLEVTAIGPDGTRTPIALTGRRSTDGDPRRVVLHWELQERARPIAPAEAPAGPDKAQPPTERLRAMAEAASDLARQQTPAMTLAHVAQQARTAVPACDEVGVTLVRAKGRIETPAATGELAAACDQLQYDLGEGPCLGALDDSTPVRVRDMANDSRWPRFGPRASMLGVGSMLALPLHAPRGTVGALNLYARATNAFDQDDELIGLAFATHAGIALAHAEMEANLRIGLETREEIGRAVGILMERHRVTAAAAFDMLVVASQHSHRKLRDIAAWMNETGEDPAALVRGKAH